MEPMKLEKIIDCNSNSVKINSFFCMNTMSELNMMDITFCNQKDTIITRDKWDTQFGAE